MEEGFRGLSAAILRGRWEAGKGLREAQYLRKLRASINASWSAKEKALVNNQEGGRRESGVLIGGYLLAPAKSDCKNFLATETLRIEPTLLLVCKARANSPPAHHTP